MSRKPGQANSLTADREQLSALDHPHMISAQQPNIQQDLESQQEEIEDGGNDEPAHQEDDVPSTTTATSTASSTSASDTVRSLSVSTRNCCSSLVSKILEFPALEIIFPVTFVFSIFFTMICVVVSGDPFLYLKDPVKYPSAMPSINGFVLTLFGVLFLLFCILLATRQMCYQLISGNIKPFQIIGLYLSTILLYGNMYLLCLFTDVSSFVFIQPIPTTNIVSVFIGFQYFSVTTITCTGYGDITPASGIPKAIVSTQLLMSLFYHIGIFSISLSHFQAHVEAVGKGKLKDDSNSIVGLARSKMRDFRTKYPRLDAIRKMFIASVFPVSLIIQFIFLIILHVYDPNMFSQDASSNPNAGGATQGSTFIIFLFFLAQLLQFILILLMTLALVRQINKSYVSPGFLIQSWLATVSLFAGLYVLIFLTAGYDSFVIWTPSDYAKKTPHSVAEVVGYFFYFSLCTMTTTGYGDIYPVHLVARIFVSFQMITSICYTIVILGQALASTVGFIKMLREEQVRKKKLKGEIDEEEGGEGEEGEIYDDNDDNGNKNVSQMPVEDISIDHSQIDVNEQDSMDEEESQPHPAQQQQQQQRTVTKQQPQQRQPPQQQQQQQARRAPAQQPRYVDLELEGDEEYHHPSQHGYQPRPNQQQQRSSQQQQPGAARRQPQPQQPHDDAFAEYDDTSAAQSAPSQQPTQQQRAKAALQQARSRAAAAASSAAASASSQAQQVMESQTVQAKKQVKAGVQQVQQQARPVIQQGKQALTQAGQAAKARIQQQAQQQRSLTSGKGMFDPELDEAEEI